MTQETSAVALSPADGLADIVRQIRDYGGAPLSTIRSAMRVLLGVPEDIEVEPTDSPSAAILSSATSIATAIFRACEQESIDEAKIVVRLLLGGPRIMIADIEGAPSMTRFLAEIEGPEFGSGPWGVCRGESEASALVCAALQARLRISFPDHPMAASDFGLLPLWMVSRAGEPWPCRDGMTIAAASASEAISIYGKEIAADAGPCAAICIGVSDEASPCVVYRLTSS